MNWSDVGTWIEKNAGPVASVIGTMVGGPIPAAVAAGVKLIAAATGKADPAGALQAFQTDPATVVRLQELANAAQEANLAHIEKMAEVEAQDAQASQREAQQTIRAADAATDPFVRRARPKQAYLYTFAAILYPFACLLMHATIESFVLGTLMAYPIGYAGFRWNEKTTFMRAQAKQ
jgi:hypothetical protein